MIPTKEMTLFEKVRDLIELGYSVQLTPYSLQFIVKLSKDNIERESWLPLSDHFTENRIVAC